ncbi:hypothetical protein V1T76_03470 [Roseibium sp. FZY0029]|uniref:hypothetical protein n=1 Tax=Roseibium sp. FZY0029 TaxID=3116647 RepID=UPI002EC77CA8|nr:hypothetical protein [Roseibium sp. FZY0029]
MISAAAARRAPFAKDFMPFHLQRIALGRQPGIEIGQTRRLQKTIPLLFPALKSGARRWAGQPITLDPSNWDWRP